MQMEAQGEPQLLAQSPPLQEVPLEVAQKLPQQLEQLQRNSQQLIDLGNVKDPTLIRQLLPVADISTHDSPASLTAEALARAGGLPLGAQYQVFQC